MAGFPEILIFPHIDTDERVLKSLLILFREIWLLQPAFSAPSYTTEACAKRGWVRIERPLPLMPDSNYARELLKRYEEMGALHKDSGYLTYLRHGGSDRLEREPGWELIKDIRDYGKKPVAAVEERRLKGAILLQMAQDLDSQRIEIQEILDELGDKELNVKRSIGIDLEEEDGFDWDAASLPGPEEDDFLIPQRMSAWGDMYRVLDASPRPCLFTENPPAVEHLIENAKKVEGSEENPVVLVRIEVPRYTPKTVDGVDTVRRALDGLLPWRIFCERFDGLLDEATNTPPSGLEAKGRALSAYFQESVFNPMIERLTRTDVEWEEGWRKDTFEALLFLGSDADDLMSGNARPKTASGADQQRQTPVLRLNRNRDRLSH